MRNYKFICNCKLNCNYKCTQQFLQFQTNLFNTLIKEEPMLTSYLEYKKENSDITFFNYLCIQNVNVENIEYIQLYNFVDDYLTLGDNIIRYLEDYEDEVCKNSITSIKSIEILKKIEVYIKNINCNQSYINNYNIIMKENMKDKTFKRLYLSFN